jgi:hypothetical protein
LPFSNTQINNSSQSLILNKITNKIAISHSWTNNQILWILN